MPTRGSVLVKRVLVTLPTRGSVLVKRVPDKPPSHRDDNNDLYHLEDEEEDLVKFLLHVTVNTMRKNNPPDYIGNTTYHMSTSSVWIAYYPHQEQKASTFVSVFFLTLGLQSIFYSTQLTRLLLVNHLICNAVQQFRGHSINQQLAHFFEDPLSFRSIMAQTHTVISGSFALQFLDGTYYPNSDLDLYILPNDTLLVLGAYLLCQGYIYGPKEWQQEEFLEDTQHVLATLDVIPDIEDKDTPNYQSKSIHTIILVFYSTCVMNIITYNAAFSLYPYATFNRRESLMLDMKMYPAKAMQLDTTGVAIFSSPSLLVSNLAWDPITERGWTLGTHFSYGAEIIVQTPGINLYLSSSPYTPSNFHHILPFLLPPRTLEKMMLDISSSQEIVAKTIAWWDLVVPALRELYGMGQHF
ncbi:hypothetical protein V8D89_015004 [Ganoderma adspersum]